MGPLQEQTQHELRQTESCPQILLRQGTGHHIAPPTQSSQVNYSALWRLTAARLLPEHHQEGKRTEVCLQVRESARSITARRSSMLRHQPGERRRRPRQSAERPGRWSSALPVKGPSSGTCDVEPPLTPVKISLTRLDCWLVQRSSPCSSQKSSRNDYMKSGLYSTFTIQSLQAPPPPRPVKPELLIQQDPAPKADCPSREVSDIMVSFWGQGSADGEARTGTTVFTP